MIEIPLERLSAMECKDNYLIYDDNRRTSRIDIMWISSQRYCMEMSDGRQDGLIDGYPTVFMNLLNDRGIGSLYSVCKVLDVGL